MRIVLAHPPQVRTASPTPTSVYKGVRWSEHRNMWLASITTNGKTTKLGYFQDEQEAANAYDKRAGRLRLTLNFPRTCDDDGACSDSEVRDQAWYIQATALRYSWLDVSAAPTAPLLG